jgi:hypothetical protein
MGHGIRITPYGGENSRKQVLPSKVLCVMAPSTGGGGGRRELPMIASTGFLECRGNSNCLNQMETGRRASTTTTCRRVSRTPLFDKIHSASVWNDRDGQIQDTYYGVYLGKGSTGTLKRKIPPSTPV